MIEHTFSYPFQLEIDAIVVKKRIHAREAKEINPQSLFYLTDSKPSVLELVTPDLVKFNHFTCIFFFIFITLICQVFKRCEIWSVPLAFARSTFNKHSNHVTKNIIFTLFHVQNTENRNII